ncbi:MAG: sulfotransferase [Proteobacteria bacterium]|nr:sulfotransferase [Pseudomonadota bacterium]
MSLAEDRLWAKIRRYLESGQETAARISLQSLVARAPGDIEAHVMLGGAILSGDGLVRECNAQLEAAAHALPDDADKAAMVALAMFRIGNILGARSCLENADVARTTSPENLMSLAHVHQLLGEHAKSLAFMDRAKAQGYDNPDFRYFRGVQLQFNGRLAEAGEAMESCLKMGPTFGRASYTLARLRKQTPESNHLAYIHEQLKRVEPDTEDHASFEFALFKEYEDLGDVDNAWAALERGNAIMHRRLGHDPAEEGELFDQLIERTGADFLRPAEARHEGPQPIFVLGLPRSGTTLLERILGNHSMVESVGELSDFPRQLQWQANRYAFPPIDPVILARADGLDYAEIGKRYLEHTQWRANGKAFYVDKLPPNFLLAGFIRRALPHAPILHMVRDPMDACFSNYKAMFGGSYAYSYEQKNLVTHYTRYRRLMDHWHRAMPGHIFDVSYNELVRDAEAGTRAILDFCKLPYEAGCVDLSRNRTPVATMSSAQTRDKISDRSIGEWRRYEKQLAWMRSKLAAFDR